MSAVPGECLGCKKSSGDLQRGLCRSCYGHAYRRITAGRTTWTAEINAGRARELGPRGPKARTRPPRPMCATCGERAVKVYPDGTRRDSCDSCEAANERHRQILGVLFCKRIERERRERGLVRGVAGLSSLVGDAAGKGRVPPMRRRGRGTRGT